MARPGVEGAGTRAGRGAGTAPGNTAGAMSTQDVAAAASRKRESARWVDRAGDENKNKDSTALAVGFGNNIQVAIAAPCRNFVCYERSSSWHCWLVYFQRCASRQRRSRFFVDRIGTCVLPSSLRPEGASTEVVATLSTQERWPFFYECPCVPS